MRVAGIGCSELLSDSKAVAVGLERVIELALRCKHVAEPEVRDRQIVLRLCVAVIGGEALGNGKGLAGGVERLIELALRLEDIADLPVGDQQIELPLRVAGIGGGELLSAGEVVTIGLERFIQLALRLEQVAESLIGPGNLAVEPSEYFLPARIAWFGGDQRRYDSPPLRSSANASAGFSNRR